MAEYEWDAADWTEKEPTALGLMAMEAGYADAVFCRHIGVDDKIMVTVTTGDDKPTFKTNVEAQGMPSLSVDDDNVQIPGDGVSVQDVTVTDSRGAGAVGKTVTLCVGPGTVVDKLSETLDANGQAVFQFGPSPSAGWKASSCCNAMRFYYESGEAAEVSFRLSYT